MGSLWSQGRLIVYDHAMESCGIYLITCSPPSGRSLYYVGQSSNVERRIGKHRSDLKCGRHHNKKMLAYWGKYGPSCFRFELAEECSECDLDGLEAWWLTDLVGHKNGFNFSAVPGSPMRGLKFSKDHAGKISRALTGMKRQPFTDEARHNMSLAQSGKVRCASTRRKISEAQSGSKNHAFGKCGMGHHRSKPIRGVCMSTGRVIAFPCARDAISMGFSASKISECCHGTRKTHKGFAWGFEINPASA